MARKKSKSKGWKIVFLVLLIIGLIGGFFAYKAYHALYSSNTTIPNNEEAFVYIKSDAAFTDIMDELRSSGYIENFETFEFVARRKGYDKSIRPGKYKLLPAMSNNEIVNKLRAGLQEPVMVKLNRESNLAEIAGAISREIEADSLQLLNLLINPDTATHYGFTPETFIAMFVPNSYEFYWATTPNMALKRFGKEYKKIWTEARRQKAAELGMTTDQVTTLASIVAQETAKRSESKRIAGVYMNRLNRGIPLQADPTLRFAANDPTIKRVLNTHKFVDSPYNTYLNKGLPPGPIGLASVDFIDAVLNYESHNYLYFCAKEDFSGFSNFTETYEQHQQNARRYQRALNAKGIMR